MGKLINQMIGLMNTIYHRIIKMSSVNVTSSTYLNFTVEIMKKILNLKLVIIFLVTRLVTCRVKVNSIFNGEK